MAYDRVAALYAVPEETLSRWVGRFDERGVDGLIEGRHTAQPKKITPEESAAYENLIQHPEPVDQTHWTGKKFHDYLTQELDQEIGYRTVVRWLYDKGFHLKVPRSWPDGQDEEKREFFVQQLQGYLSDPDVDLWYLDETGIEGDTRPRRRWS